MPEANKALIVTILVPTLGPDGDGPWDGSVGTGCAVDNGLILTARHVVQLGARRNQKHPIKVRWYALRKKGDPNSGWVNLDPDDDKAICWIGKDDDLDAALLVAPRPESLRSVQTYAIAAAAPVGLPDWESRGFPRASQDGEEAGHGDFHGRVMSGADRDALLSLSSELKAGDARAHWSGASGMPVLVGKTIVGIVKDLPDNYDKRLLRAVPTHLMRRDPAFVAALGSHLPDLRERARDLMVSALAGSDTVTRALARRFALDSSRLKECRAALADRALDTPPAQLVEKALEVKADLRARRDQAADVRVLVDFVQAVLPTETDPTEVARLAAFDPGAGCPPIALKAHTATLAEILMAAADRRGACFRTVDDDQERPVGQGCVSHVLEGGRDATGEQRLKDIQDELVALFESTFSRDLEQRLFEHLTVRVADYDSQTPGKSLTDAERAIFDAELVEHINDKLKDRARSRNYLGEGRRFTYYLIVDSPERPLSEPDRQQRDAVLAKIARRFPAIAVLCAAPRDKFPLRELKPFGSLTLLLVAEPNP